MEKDWFLYSLTLFTFFVIFTFCYIRHVFTFFERNKIESASYPGFPFGNIYDVIFHKTPMFMVLWKFYNKLKRRKCKLGGFYLFLHPALVVVDPKLAPKTVEENPDKLDNEVKEDILQIVLKKVLKILRESGSFEKEEENVSQFLEKISGDAVRELFGFKENLRKSDVWCGNFKKLIVLCFPQLKCAISDKNGEIIARCEEIMQFRKKNDERKDDVLGVLQKKGVDGQEIVDTVQVLIECLEKSNHLVAFALYELSINNEIQEDLRGEITRFKKQKTITSFRQIDELSYLETVVCELLRKFPFNPFVYKMCQEDYLVNNKSLSKNLAVFVSTFGIHHDSQNYTNPELFDPDRFSEENEKYIDSTKYLPFGYTCLKNLGPTYVKLLIKLILIELLSKYQFSLGKKSPKSIIFDERAFELRPKEDVWFKIKKIE